MLSFDISLHLVSSRSRFQQYIIYNIFIFFQQAATIAFKLNLQKHFDVTEVTILNCLK